MADASGDVGTITTYCRHDRERTSRWQMNPQPRVARVAMQERRRRIFDQSRPGGTTRNLGRKQIRRSQWKIQHGSHLVFTVSNKRGIDRPEPFDARPGDKVHQLACGVEYHVPQSDTVRTSQLIQSDMRQAAVKDH